MPGWRRPGPPQQQNSCRRPLAGRVFTAGYLVRRSDVTPGGRLRLDALARYLQDVAEDDVADSGLAEPYDWLVRRCALTIRGWPRMRPAAAADDVLLSDRASVGGTHHDRRRGRRRPDPGQDGVGGARPRHRGILPGGTGLPPVVRPGGAGPPGLRAAVPPTAGTGSHQPGLAAAGQRLRHRRARRQHRSTGRLRRRCSPGWTGCPPAPRWNTTSRYSLAPGCGLPASSPRATLTFGC